MEPEKAAKPLEEFVRDANGTRADMEAKNPGIVERAQGALDRQTEAELSARLKTIEEAKAAIERNRTKPRQPRRVNDRDF